MLWQSNGKSAKFNVVQKKSTLLAATVARAAVCELVDKTKALSSPIASAVLSDRPALRGGGAIFFRSVLREDA